MAFWAAFFPLETGAVEFLHLELLRVDAVEAAHVKHHHVLAPGPFAIGVGLDAASLAKRVMDRAVVELVVVMSFSSESNLKSDFATADNNGPSLRHREQLQAMTSPISACAS